MGWNCSCWQWNFAAVDSSFIGSLKFASWTDGGRCFRGWWVGDAAVYSRSSVVQVVMSDSVSVSELAA